jgi:demethylmenaquinone methyltransferase/2-methoxy-6-polyprenyl-1,4-benzoquinol methylase
VWRRRTAKRFADILARPEARVLDLCCGTGDLAFALERMAARARARGASEGHAQIFGSDFALPMLARAFEKAESVDSGVPFLASDALSLPFADAKFDLVTAAFGFRNLANYERGLCEIARVLRPGGEVGILEFSDPQEGIGAAGFRFYFQHILPRIGGAISGNRDAYAYLPSSVTKFPPPAQLAAWLENAGFENVRFELWKLGSVALHTGAKKR